MHSVMLTHSFKFFQHAEISQFLRCLSHPRSRLKRYVDAVFLNSYTRGKRTKSKIYMLSCYICTIKVSQSLWTTVITGGIYSSVTLIMLNIHEDTQEIK